MPLNPLDEQRLEEALALAHGAIGLSDPNPRVGCIIADASGTVVAKAHTGPAGDLHAEAAATRAALRAGARLEGGTAWVTLEPCSHHGRTPPCCDALIAARLQRVVVAHVDPFPAVCGEGIARLRAAGIEVDLADGKIVERCRELNVGFLSRIERGRPWVRVKAAASLDGRTALPNGASQWITSADARIDGHRWRKRASAIVTGCGTVLRDDPRLDVRHVETFLQPLRVVLDSTLRVPPTARVLAPPGQCLIVTTQSRQAVASALAQRGVNVLELPGGRDGRVDLAALLVELGQRGANEVHVEAGATLSGALVRAGFCDELLLYVAPTLIGEGPGIANIGLLAGLANAPRFEIQSLDRVGPDLRLRCRLTSACRDA